MTTTTALPSAAEAEAADSAMMAYAFAMDALVAHEIDETDWDDIRRVAISTWNRTYGSGGEMETEAIEDIAWGFKAKAWA